ncbi:hypothetical protein [uncultured Tenacibaculum sp.]|nr:hypothetical protein [uncultured Tenacibaculum sp.]TCI84656.1 hypothetical protein EYW44_20360 [Tenacibaculum sp. M341]
MIECGTSDVVFDLEFKLNLIKEDNDSLRYKEYVHVDKKDINFKANRNFDYDIKVSRLYDKMFSVNIGIGIGDTIIIDGMDYMGLKESTPKSWSSSKTIVGPYVTLMLEGVIEENVEGIFQAKIAPTELNSQALKFFNKNFAEFNKSYTLNLSLN